MGYKILETNRDFHTYQYLIDTEADLDQLPLTVEGSFALCADTGDVYVLNTAQVWKKL